MSHLQDCSPYEPMQSTDRRHDHSAETALLKIADDILRAVDNKKAAIVLLLDLSAAFDTIDHEVLFHRLQQDFIVSATAPEWFRSYLHCRRQSVNIDGSVSKEAFLTCGIPHDDTQLYVTFDPRGQLKKQQQLRR
ncbi:uncharacterized protein [Diadema antillarum]|uniref:uncharacterized protein n=1 Tax=Diadema antillarum TaxID=105358 RepID=UPI003A86C253